MSLYVERQAIYAFELGAGNSTVSVFGVLAWTPGTGVFVPTHFVIEQSIREVGMALGVKYLRVLR